MALATFKDLCIDAVDSAASQRFWAAALGLQPVDRDGQLLLTGFGPRETVWINQVGEPKTVKNRAHLDVNAGSVADLVRLGASKVADVEAWTVLTDPDGQEFCAFVRDEVEEYRLYELVIDAVDPHAIAAWWGRVLGGEYDDDADSAWLTEVPEMPFESLVFVRVPEPKTVKNRVHFDVDAAGLPPLLEAGAVLLREKGGDIGWSVFADPEGNEFCVFLPA
jgi:catechol 2,3-dioxygenase-like lactoylglutathione lyase family enzyme